MVCRAVAELAWHCMFARGQTPLERENHVKVRGEPHTASPTASAPLILGQRGAVGTGEWVGDGVQGPVGATHQIPAKRGSFRSFLFCTELPWGSSNFKEGEKDLRENLAIEWEMMLRALVLTCHQVSACLHLQLLGDACW